MEKNKKSGVERGKIYWFSLYVASAKPVKENKDTTRIIICLNNLNKHLFKRNSLKTKKLKKREKERKNPLKSGVIENYGVRPQQYFPVLIPAAVKDLSFPTVHVASTAPAAR